MSVAVAAAAAVVIGLFPRLHAMWWPESINGIQGRQQERIRLASNLMKLYTVCLEELATNDHQPPMNDTARSTNNNRLFMAKYIVLFYFAINIETTLAKTESPLHFNYHNEVGYTHTNSRNDSIISLIIGSE